MVVVCNLSSKQPPQEGGPSLMSDWLKVYGYFLSQCTIVLLFDWTVYSVVSDESVFPFSLEAFTQVRQ